MRPEGATTLLPGDRVRRRDSGMTGTVRRVLLGNPLATRHMHRVDRVEVEWDDSLFTLHSILAASRVEKIAGLVP